MMLYPAIDDLRKKVDSRYTLCMLAAKRARDLIDGAPVLLEDEEVPIRKVSVAAEEIEEDLITYKTAEQVEQEKEEARLAREQARKKGRQEPAGIFEQAEAMDQAKEESAESGEEEKPEEAAAQEGETAPEKAAEEADTPEEA